MICGFTLDCLRELIAAIFMTGGMIFFIGSAVGMLRLPDFYSRVHASGNSETLGCTLSFLGLMIYEGLTLTTAKMAFVFLLVFLANPIGSHILSKAAYKTGHPVWTLKSKDAEEKLSGGFATTQGNEPVGSTESKPKEGK